MTSVKLVTATNWKNTVDPLGEWLDFEIDGKNNVISIRCILCSKFADKLKMKRNFNPGFINGITGNSLKKDNIIKHSKSDMHVTAVNLEHKPDSVKKIMDTPIGKAMFQASNEEENKVGKLIDISYLIAKQELPFSLFPEIALLEKRHGVQLGETYLNDKKCQEFCQCIADTFKEDLNLELKSTNYVSVMVDESTDISVKEKLLVYVRFIGNDGTVKTKFVALKDLTNTTAKGILDTLLKILSDYGIDDISKKLVGFCSDGARVNLGIRQGLVVLIKEQCPWLISIHCFNHRLELAVKDSMTNSYFEKVISVLMFLYSFYKRSSKRRREVADLANIFEQEENSKNFSPSNIQGTRWIDYKRRAVAALINSYTVVIAHLENTVEDHNEDSVDKAKISGFLKILKSRKFVFYLLLMSKVCEALGKLSLCLQKDSCNLLNAKTYLDRFEIFIETVKCDSLMNDEIFMSVIKSGEFCSIQLSGQEIDINTAYTYLKSLSACVKERFADLSSGVVNCLKVLDVSIWPQNKDSLEVFGNEEINILVDNFSLLLQKHKVITTSISDEWAELKSLWLLNWTHLSREEVWTVITKSKKDLFPNLSHVFEILLILPASNALVERCFSYMCRIKTDFRSRMNEDVLENLIRICVEGPEIENFSSDRAVKIFFSKPRRPNVEKYGKRKHNFNEDE